MRRILLVLLGFGVFAGYGSAIASARWHARHGGGCESRWGHHSLQQRPEEARPAAPAPQTVVVPQAAPAPAQQIFLIMPGAQAPQAAVPQVITIPMPAQAQAQAQAPAPAPVPASP